MEAPLPAILLRLVWSNPLAPDSEAHPADRKRREPAGTRRRERGAVVAADRLSHAKLLKRRVEDLT
jgi:hypothetical protein